ncbi:sterol desaturase family protein [Mesorhizobium atlanticum]|uniref:Sterol desaturase family protein n=1 Tax=Mesorhizobium atlanticum TaxID=2233532 RepID=A0A330GFX0_9HYPH|nr:sterol desaturase family protein [Mesorhizobium atlanticum]RAZ71383.1 sterol desaturase family protein [Mesorhizobium atlanticum]
MDVFSLKPLLICALIFIPLERVLTLRPQKILRRGIFTDLIYATCNGAAVNLLLGMMAVPLINAAAFFAPASVTQALGGQSLWLQVLEIVVLTDLGVYAVHRTFHAVPFLWRFHSIHHGVEEMDWLAAFHTHPFEQIITKSIILIPVFVLGFSTEAIYLYFVIYTGQALLIHSNVKLNFGPLRWLIASPQFHHWHHAGERAAYDKNFAGQLAIIDLLFGTFRVPGSSTPSKYGVDAPIPRNFFGQLGYPMVPRKLLAKPRSAEASDAEL